MGLKKSICYSSVACILILVFLSGPVSAADTWLRVDPQDQVIAWEKMNADTINANLFPYASAGTGSALFTTGTLLWKNLSGDPLTQVIPGQQPAVQPSSPTTGQTTIDGTPVSELFKNAMDNYRINPPKPLVIPGGNDPIYSDQIPINWS